MIIKHTPGTWHIAGNEIHDRQTRYDKDGARTGETPNAICTIEIMPLGQQTANARLIAACPELLDALKIIDANAGESVEWIRRHARTAIAKVEGVEGEH